VYSRRSEPLASDKRCSVHTLLRISREELPAYDVQYQCHEIKDMNSNGAEKHHDRVVSWFSREECRTLKARTIVPSHSLSILLSDDARPAYRDVLLHSSKKAYANANQLGAVTRGKAVRKWAAIRVGWLRP
jgi:hypothetical protein